MKFAAGSPGCFRGPGLVRNVEWCFLFALSNAFIIFCFLSDAARPEPDGTRHGAVWESSDLDLHWVVWWCLMPPSIQELQVNFLLLGGRVSLIVQGWLAVQSAFESVVVLERCLKQICIQVHHDSTPWVGGEIGPCERMHSWAAVDLGRVGTFDCKGVVSLRDVWQLAVGWNFRAVWISDLTCFPLSGFGFFGGWLLIFWVRAKRSCFSTLFWRARGARRRKPKEEHVSRSKNSNEPYPT